AGVGGHELALLDFEPLTAGPIRRLGQAVATAPAPDLETALAVAGSAAQGRVQPYPADTDFFERVHVRAPSREAALRRLGEVVRETVERVEARPSFALEEVWFGVVPPHLAAGQAHRLGTALAWRFADVAAGAVTLPAPGEGTTVPVGWAEAAADPGFVKLDWFVDDRAFGGPRRVSKVIDPTWATPDGRVVSLDGAIDGDFQQVYLAAAAAVLAQRLVGGDCGDRRAYVAAMERDVLAHRRRRPPDYGKVAKRLYNLCRLTGRYAEALFVRDLLAATPARLHRSRAALEVAALAGATGASEATAALAEQLDALARELAGEADCHGPIKASREALAAPEAAGLEAAMRALDARLGERINAGFRERLLGYEPTAALLAELEERYPWSERTSVSGRDARPPPAPPSPVSCQGRRPGPERRWLDGDDASWNNAGIDGRARRAPAGALGAGGAGRGRERDGGADGDQSAADPPGSGPRGRDQGGPTAASYGRAGQAGRRLRRVRPG
ncbi:MAG: hypothetical protein M3Q10_13685, partial [Chloroflexota bacterium]|nr:hypothetical protein [Chloroflexota bacterium]